MAEVGAWFVAALRTHPEMAVLLTLAVGYAIGRTKIGSIPLGAVVGVLIAGAVIGQIDVEPAPELKTFFFLLFLFSIGYRTGPQFFGGLRSSGLPQVVLTIVFCVTALALGYAAASIFEFDAGTAAGLLAGATTESATIGTATDAINHLPIDQAAKDALVSNMAVAFAVTYFLGVLATVTFVARLGPRILGVDLPAACAQLERDMGLVGEDVVATGYQPFVFRALRVEVDAYVGKSVREMEAAFVAHGRRLFVARLRRGEVIHEGSSETVLRRGDVIAIGGRVPSAVAAQSAIGVEVDDKELLDFPVETTDVIVTERAYTRVPLGEFLRRAELDTLRGVGVKRVTRGGAELPLTLGLKLARGDVVTLVGTPEAVAKTAARIGYIDRPSSTTDMAIVATVIFVGGLIGLPALEIGRLELGLSQSVGVLLSGLVLGWLRSVDRRVPRLPEATVWLFDSLGLTVFLAVTALAAGPDFVTGLRQSGLSLLAGAIVLVVVPQFVTMLVGRFAFRMHPGILLGVCSGASTSAPSLAAVQEVARSKVPTLGYGVTYAVGNVLLALWGSVIVALMTV